MLDLAMERFSDLVKNAVHEDKDEEKMELLTFIHNSTKTLQKFTNILFEEPKVIDQKRSLETSEQVPAKKLNLSPSPLMDLPNEIWMKILGYLPTSDILRNFNLTCKHFHFLATNPGAIKFLELKNVDKSDQYQQIVKVLKRSKTLNKLTIDNCSTHMNHILAHALKSNHLRTLEVLGYEATLSKKNVEYIKNSNINVLKLESINLKDDEMQIIGALKTLKSIRISNLANSRAMDVSELIKTLANVNTRIEDLALVSRRHNGGHLRINNLTLRNFLISKTDSLKKLKVICYVTKEDKSNNDKVKWSASPNLEELYFMDYCSKSDRTFKIELGLDMPKLTELVLFNIEGEMLNVLGSKSFPLLERLNLHRGSGAEFGVGTPDRQHILDILENCPSFKSVRLSQFGLSNPQPADDWHTFLYEVYENFNVYINILKPRRLIIFEEYLKKTSLTTFYKYTKMKANYLDWSKEGI